ncbi:hypothetical protein PAAL109150_16240 [Paenibacillus alkaliterrae]
MGDRSGAAALFCMGWGYEAMRISGYMGIGILWSTIPFTQDEMAGKVGRRQLPAMAGYRGEKRRY